MLIDPAAFWNSSDLRARQRFQKLVFPAGLAYFSGEFGTAPTSIVFNLLRGDSGGLSNLAPLITKNWNQIVNEIRVLSDISRLANAG
jgi:hypothetical protein